MAGVDPQRATTIEPADVGLSQHSSYVVYSQTKYGGKITNVARFGRGASAVRVTEHACKGASQCDKTQLFIAAPVLQNGWAVLGETTKMVAVSTQRISSIIAFTNSSGSSTSSATAAVVVELMGSAGEAVEMGFMAATGDIVLIRCTISMSGRVRMVAGINADEACQVAE